MFHYRQTRGLLTTGSCLSLVLVGGGAWLDTGRQQASQPLASALPVPAAGRGHARGTYLHKGVPRQDMPVYLIRLQDDFSPARTVAPVACTDAKGAWLARDVQPGRYVTAAFKPPETLFGFTSKDIHEVKEGSVTEFGVETLMADSVEDCPPSLRRKR